MIILLLIILSSPVSASYPAPCQLWDDNLECEDVTIHANGTMEFWLKNTGNDVTNLTTLVNGTVCSPSQIILASGQIENFTCHVKASKGGSRFLGKLDITYEELFINRNGEGTIRAYYEKTKSQKTTGQIVAISLFIILVLAIPLFVLYKLYRFFSPSTFLVKFGVVLILCFILMVYWFFFLYFFGM